VAQPIHSAAALPQDNASPLFTEGRAWNDASGVGAVEAELLWRRGLGSARVLELCTFDGDGLGQQSPVISEGVLKRVKEAGAEVEAAQMPGFASLVASTALQQIGRYTYPEDARVHRLVAGGAGQKEVDPTREEQVSGSAGVWVYHCMSEQAYIWRLLWEAEECMHAMTDHLHGKDTARPGVFQWMAASGEWGIETPAAVDTTAWNSSLTLLLARHVQAAVRHRWYNSCPTSLSSKLPRHQPPVWTAHCCLTPGLEGSLPFGDVDATLEPWLRAAYDVAKAASTGETPEDSASEKFATLQHVYTGLQLVTRAAVLLSKFTGPPHSLPASSCSARAVSSLLRRSCDTIILPAGQLASWTAIASTRKRYEETSVTLNRFKALARGASGVPDQYGEGGSVFAQLAVGMGASVDELKKSYLWAKRHPIEVNFMGENSEDAGGPWRQVLSDVCHELSSGGVALLMPTPNGKAGVGTFQEALMPDPRSQHPAQLSLFVWLGQMLGMTVCTGEVLDIALHPIVYRFLLGEEVGEAVWKELDQIDADALGWIRAGLGESMGLELVWTYTSWTGEERELRPGGASMAVQPAECEAYAAARVEARVRELRPALLAIRRGFNSIIPPFATHLWPWTELEVRVTGRPTIDIQFLRSIAKYDDPYDHDHPVIQRLWRVLEHDFTERERQEFLVFVWGKARLPTTRSDTHTVFQVSPLHGSDEHALPVAHTCFFQLDLPEYPSQEVMAKKLRIALEFTGGAIDGDGDDDDRMAMSALT
jgi:hypothetical protein